MLVSWESLIKWLVNATAFEKAFGGSNFLAKNAANADAKVHPVPWVFLV